MDRFGAFRLQVNLIVELLAKRQQLFGITLRKFFHVAKNQRSGVVTITDGSFDLRDRFAGIHAGNQGLEVGQVFANAGVQNFAAVEFGEETTFFFAETYQSFVFFAYPFCAEAGFAAVCPAVSSEWRKHSFWLGFANVLEVVEHGALFVAEFVLRGRCVASYMRRTRRNVRNAVRPDPVKV